MGGDRTSFGERKPNGNPFFGGPLVGETSVSGLIRLVLALQVEASFPKEVIESALVSGQKHDRHTPDLTSKENLHQHVAPCHKQLGPSNSVPLLFMVLGRMP